MTRGQLHSGETASGKSPKATSSAPRFIDRARRRPFPMIDGRPFVYDEVTTWPKAQ